MIDAEATARDIHTVTAQPVGKYLKGPVGTTVAKTPQRQLHGDLGLRKGAKEEKEKKEIGLVMISRAYIVILSSNFIFQAFFPGQVITGKDFGGGAAVSS